MQSSTGGTDILAMILKRFSSLDIGMALLYVDATAWERDRAVSTIHFGSWE